LPTVSAYRTVVVGAGGSESALPAVLVVHTTG
jgi:hypothetical protein